jgi:hypothetical protein
MSHPCQECSAWLSLWYDPLDPPHGPLWCVLLCIVAVLSIEVLGSFLWGKDPRFWRLLWFFPQQMLAQVVQYSARLRYTGVRWDGALRVVHVQDAMLASLAFA